VSLISSVELLWLHSPLCSIPVDMRHMNGPNFIIKIRTWPPPIRSWVHVRLSLIFTFSIDYYAIQAISMFLQVSMQIWFGNLTTVGWQDILAWRNPWTFFRNIFIGQNFDRTSASILDLELLVPFPNQTSKIKSYTPLFLLSRSLGNPYEWITCLAFRTPSKEMTVYLWSLIGFRRWPSS